jgi:hypothetical protein
MYTIICMAESGKNVQRWQIECFFLSVADSTVQLQYIKVQPKGECTVKCFGLHFTSIKSISIQRYLIFFMPTALIFVGTPTFLARMSLLKGHV